MNTVDLHLTAEAEKLIREPMEVKYNWAGLCRLSEALLWARYGYWLPRQAPPEWYAATLALAVRAAALAAPPVCKWEITGERSGCEFCGVFRLWDEANPWVLSDKTRFRYPSRIRAETEYSARAHNWIRLHNGTVVALIRFWKTGDPVPEDWLPASQQHWKRRGYKASEHLGRVDLSLLRRLVRKEVNA